MTRRCESRSDASRALRPGFILVGILMIAVNLRAPITTVGPVIDLVRYTQHLNQAAASLLIALPVLSFAMCTPFAPLVALRFGLERSTLAALVLLGVGTVVRSLPVIAALWIGTVLIGLALALINVQLASLVKKHFPHRTSRVTGYYTAAQSAAAAGASMIAVPLAGESAEGWRLALASTLGLVFVAIGMAVPLASREEPPRDAHPRHTGTANSQRSHHFRPDTLIFSWRSSVAHARRHWSLAVFTGLQSLVYYVILTWWPTIEQMGGTSAQDAGFHLGALQVIAVPASLAAGIFLQLRGNDARSSVLLFGAPGVIGILGQLWSPGLAVLWVTLIGLSVGGTFVIATSLFSLRAASAREAAAIAAFALTAGYTLAAFGSIAFGALATVTGSWHASLVALVVLQCAILPFGIACGRPPNP